MRWAARDILRAVPIGVSSNRNSSTTSENIHRKKPRERSFTRIYTHVLNRPGGLDLANVRRGVCAIEALRIRDYARTGTLAVRSSLPQLTQAPLIARRIAFQMQ